MWRNDKIHGHQVLISVQLRMPQKGQAVAAKDPQRVRPTQNEANNAALSQNDPHANL